MGYEGFLFRGFSLWEGGRKSQSRIGRRKEE